MIVDSKAMGNQYLHAPCMYTADSALALALPAATRPERAVDSDRTIRRSLGCLAKLCLNGLVSKCLVHQLGGCIWCCWRQRLLLFATTL